MKVDWLADVLRGAGLNVYEMPGWKEAGTLDKRTGQPRELARVDAIICHHTATTRRWLDGHVAALLRKGRLDLAGPLSQTGLERDGTWVCVAAGRCNHNGYGTWGNNTIGVEAYNDGVGELWSNEQYASYVKGVAAIAHYLNMPMARVLGHRETTPGKPDPYGIHMGAFRLGVISHVLTFRDTLTTDTTTPTGLTEEPLLMAAAKDDLDAQKALVRQWMHMFLGRGPASVEERDSLLWVFATEGADECLTRIVDTEESIAWRNR